MVPKSIEEKISEFVARARQAAGENLESVILYGSAANGEFHEEFSNVNLFCVIRDSSFAALEKLGPVVKWWTGQKQPPPLVMTRGELEHSTDVFSIEVLDMKQHHKVLYGSDAVGDLAVSMASHRVQVEYELREKLLLLRQMAMQKHDSEKELWQLMLRSVASFATLFRHALIAVGKAAPVSKRESVTQLCAIVDFDSAAFLQVLEAREKTLGLKSVNVKDLFARYIAAVEKVTKAVDEALAS